METRERLLGGIWGLLVGDALGVPYEFKDPSVLPPFDHIEMEPPAGFPRTYRGLAPGTWSDDGALALCVLESLVEKGRLDVEDLGRRMLDWLDHGHLAVGGHVFDVGGATSSGLSKLRAGHPARECGGRTDRDNGNGALMRVLPLALWHRGTDAELVEDAHLQGLPTHGHARSQVCCALYCLWARRLMHDVPNPFDDAATALRAIYRGQGEHARELDTHVLPPGGFRARGTGYVVDTLHSARVVLAEPTYERVVRAAVALGHDTDTTACVAGGLAGLRDGLSAIPRRWLEVMRDRHLVDPLAEALVRRA